MNKTITLSAFAFIFFVILTMAGCPVYQVWRNGKHGEAELKRATYNRRIAIQEALAKKEAAEFLAQADTIRAHGIASSNSIIGQSLNNNEAYLRWLWIDELSKQQNVIYVSTEGNMPILEAGRLPLLKKRDTTK